MTEYIDREALLAEFEWLKSVEYPYQRDRTEDAIQRIKNAPVADVAPVKHGSWMSRYHSGTTVAEGVVSSCCDMWNERKTPYCPNCGAEMLSFYEDE